MTTESFYVLDGQDRITRVAGAVEPVLKPFLGHSIWDASPRAEGLFGPYFAEARATGEEVEFTAFYAGRLAERRVVPSGDTLTVHVTVLRELDVRTLGTLTASLEEIERELAARASGQPDPRSPGSLRALP